MPPEDQELQVLCLWEPRPLPGIEGGPVSSEAPSQPVLRVSPPSCVAPSALE